MSPVKLFHKYRGLSDFTLGSLLAAARNILPDLVGRQTRYKVTEMPSERTIRYYLSHRLLDRPLGRKGTASIFGYRHLLQVLAIKYMQSQYLPLKKIESVMRGLSNRELEQLLPEGQADTLTRKPPSSGMIPLQGTFHPPARTLPGERRWRHFTVAPGVELNLREEFAPPRNRGELDRLERRIRHLLESLFHNPGGRKKGA
jgi:DNA-binding transcriptional MerR regulator